MVIKDTHKSIFISHATPEDNDFTRWLAIKLTLAGYQVWHDLEKLKGGDVFWEKIEQAIRYESFRFIAIVTKVSITKDGVKDEFALAANIEKSTPGFVIPVRLDDLNFSQMPIGIIRKNIIDFESGWHKGLASLLDTLSEANAPKASTFDANTARDWLPSLKEGAITQTNHNELLDSNWIQILSFPPSLECARILSTQRKIAITEHNQGTPWFEHEDRIVGFAKASELVSLMSKSVILKPAGGVEIETFLRGGATLGDKTILRIDAQKRVGHLVRQAWELAMEAKGLLPHELSGGKRVYYVPNSLTKKERVAFLDVDGRTRRKGLNGRSEKRKANWSYAVGIVPAFDDPLRIELRSTIVFTDDDGKPFESTARAHKLRRSFCKSWWNDRWRGFLRAFLALIANGQPELNLKVGHDRFIVVSAIPIMFSAPVGLSDIAAPIDEDTEDEPEDEDILLDEFESELDEA
jgi:TIR domain